MDQPLQNQDKDIYDIEEISEASKEINVNYFKNIALARSQQSLLDADLKVGCFKYLGFMEQLEIFAKSDGTLGPEYDKEIEEYKQSAAYQNESKDFVRWRMLGNKMLALIMREKNKKKPILDSLKF